MNRIFRIIPSLYVLLLSSCAASVPPHWDYIYTMDVHREGNEYLFQLENKRAPIVRVDANYKYAGQIESAGLPFGLFVKGTLPNRIDSMVMVSDRWGIFKDEIPDDFPNNNQRETLLKWTEGVNDTMIIELVAPTPGNDGQLVRTQIHCDTSGDNEWFNVIVMYSEPFTQNNPYASWKERSQTDRTSLLADFKERAIKAYTFLPKAP